MAFKTNNKSHSKYYLFGEPRRGRRAGSSRVEGFVVKDVKRDDLRIVRKMKRYRFPRLAAMALSTRVLAVMGALVHES